MVAFFLILKIFVFSSMWVGEASSHATIAISKQSVFLQTRGIYYKAQKNIFYTHGLITHFVN